MAETGESALVARNRQAALAGDAVAQYNLGNMYRLGYQVAADLGQAVHWLTLSARQGNADAVRTLEHLAAQGLLPSADGGSDPAVDALPPLPAPEPDADALEIGGSAPDPRILRAAAEAGDGEAQLALGNLCRDAGRDAEAAQWYGLAAAGGLPGGVFSLGVCHERGLGVTADMGKALDCYRRAAEAGLAEAQYNLGNLYLAGRGVAADAAQAAQWFERAAAAGLAAACFLLGVLSEQGRGVAQDAARAADLYARAAGQGLAEAQFNLANLLREGRGVEADAQEAAYFYRRAAEQGLAEAQLNLGLLLARGAGVPQDGAQALHWLRRAADGGNARAARLLARAPSGTGEGRP